VQRSRTLAQGATIGCGTRLAPVAWDDSDLNIDWPLAEPLISDKDGCHPRLCEVDSSLLPVFDKG